MAGFHDHFSRQSAAYAQYRPTYPKSLYQFLADSVPARDAAWDAGTGNGQCAVALAEYFTTVHASDPSAQQIANARPHPRVTYAVGPAEASGLADASLDLVTVAQAAHWFDFNRFVPEVRRVLKPGGVVALWAYAFHDSGDAALDAVLNEFKYEILGPYWPQQPKMIWNGYADLPFPFDPIPAPAFILEADWSLPDMLGYFESWSATQNFIAAHGHHPLRDIKARIAAAWGDPQTRRRFVCPLALKIGRV
jgi:SAM-dependent methyltransferase